MITINLLPHHLRPIKRTPLPYVASLAFLLLALMLMGTLFLTIRGNIAFAQKEFKSKEAELAALADVVEEFNQLSEEKLKLEEKITIIKEILSDRIVWSEQLNRLAALTPDNFWYKAIRVVSQNIKEKRIKMDSKTGKPMMDRRTGKPQVEWRNVPTPVLEISGYVINNEQGESQITPLTESTTADLEFAELFQFFRPRFEDTEFNGFAVRGFTLEYKINAGGGE